MVQLMPKQLRGMLYENKKNKFENFYLKIIQGNSLQKQEMSFLQSNIYISNVTD